MGQQLESNFKPPPKFSGGSKFQHFVSPGRSRLSTIQQMGVPREFLGLTMSTDKLESSKAVEQITNSIWITWQHSVPVSKISGTCCIGVPAAWVKTFYAPYFCRKRTHHVAFAWSQNLWLCFVHILLAGCDLTKKISCPVAPAGVQSNLRLWARQQVHGMCDLKDVFDLPPRSFPTASWSLQP